VARRFAAALVVVAAAATATVFGATLAPAAAASATSRTGGSGGSMSDATFRTFTSPTTGRTGKYHLWTGGLDASKPVGLMLQFHGDGAFEFDHPDSSYSLGGPDGIRAQARRHNMILVAMRSTNTGSSAWWRSGEANADYVRDLVQHVVYARYDIDKKRSWLVGYSGGAQFITQYLLPKHSSLFDGGGAVVFGGGGAPRVTAPPFAPGLANDFPMHWYTGARDDGSCSGSGFNALRDANSGSSFYRRRGFPVTVEQPNGLCHGLSGRFGPVTGQRLALRHGS
jgi:poly(3-hydroxybutyrate) depolymerase